VLGLGVTGRVRAVDTDEKERVSSAAGGVRSSSRSMISVPVSVSITWVFFFPTLTGGGREQGVERTGAVGLGEAAAAGGDAEATGRAVCDHPNEAPNDSAISLITILMLF
jgi:hypothetical protein